MKLNFGEIKENKILPEGDHNVTIVGAKEATSQNGTAMLVVDMNDEEGAFVRDNICLEGPGAFKAKQFFDALGIDEDDAAAMDASDLIGQTINVKIVMEEYEGENRSRVKKYLAED